MTGPRWAAVTSVAAVLLFGAVCRVDGFDDVIDSPMYRRPDLPAAPVETVFPDGLKELWLRALGRPEVEMRLQAALSIGLAHRRGMKGLDATAGPLIAALDDSSQHPAVRLAAAQTLIALNARQAAPSLFARAREGDVALNEAVEPALARWDYRPARAMWLARIGDSTTPMRSLVLAIRALGTVGESQALARLLALAGAEDTVGAIRLEAAQAAGSIRADGLEKDAETLAADATARGLARRLAAGYLLRRHAGAGAVAILQRLARDPEPAVTAVAAERLHAIAPELALPAMDHLLASPAADVRLLGVLVLFRLATPERVHLLAERLDDAHPDVRKAAREHLRTLVEKESLRRHVLVEAERVIAGNDWRGIEQATILLTKLEHRPAAERFLALLRANRPEVFVTAAWGLRSLDMPETAAPVKQYIDEELARPAPGRKNSSDLIDHQLSQLNQLLGQQKYRPADPLLRRFVPKRMGATEARAAAVWALGMLHEGDNIADLGKQLGDRLNDINGIPPEAPPVRLMAAVTLGRMNAKEELGTLRKFFTPDRAARDVVARGCGWAIMRITGEPPAASVTIRRTHADWFLAPNQ
jgi:HEAT repeat protein